MDGTITHIDYANLKVSWSLFFYTVAARLQSCVRPENKTRGALAMNNGPDLDAISTSSQIPADWFALRCHICCPVIRFHSNLWNWYCGIFFSSVGAFFFLLKPQHASVRCVNLTQLAMSDCHMKGRLHSLCRPGKERRRLVYLFDLNRPRPRASQISTWMWKRKSAARKSGCFHLTTQLTGTQHHSGVNLKTG